MKNSLSIKFSAIAAAAAIVMLLLFAFLAVNTVTKVFESEISEDLEHDSRDALDTVDQFMYERVVDLRMLTAPENSFLSLSSKSPEEKIAELERITNNSQIYASMSIYGRDGKKIADTRNLLVGIDESQSLFFKSAMEGNTHYEYRMSKSLGVPVMLFSAPIRDENGRISSVLVTRVEISKISEILSQRIKRMGGSGVYLVDGNGTVLVRQGESTLSMENDLSELAIFGKMLTSGKSEISGIYPKAGQSYIYVAAKEKGYREFRGNRWYLITETSTQEAFSYAEDMSRTLLFTGAAGIAAFVAVLYLYFARAVIAPIEKLKSLVKRIEAGDYSRRAEVNTGDEFEDLASSFNKAAEQLDKNRREHLQIDKAKTQFLTITSHELRSPMTPMKAQLQMLKEGYFGKLSAKQLDSLGIVLRNAERLDKILADFLEISRIEAARLQFTFRRTDLGATAKEVAQYMRGYLPEKKVRIVLRAEKLPEIEADPDRVSQVLRNLVGNAVKFSRPRGKVEVEACREGKFIHFSVKDNGIGISREEQQKLFEPFFQVDKTFSRKQGGTGLGLAISKGIVESQGGRIWMEPADGGGSVFHFTVPVEPVREMVPIKVLFTAKSEIEGRLLAAFLNNLGPLGASEFEEARGKYGLDRQGLADYIDHLVRESIIDLDGGDEFKRQIVEILGNGGSA